MLHKTENLIAHISLNASFHFAWPYRMILTFESETLRGRSCLTSVSESNNCFEYGRALFASALPFPGSKCLSRICITGSNSPNAPRV